MENYKEVELYSGTNEYELSQIISILKENKIPFIKKQDGIGSYMNMYMGSSIQTKRILVSEENYEDAKELISYLMSEDISKEEIKNNDDSSGKKHVRARRIFGSFAIGIPLIMIITAIMVAILK